MDIGKIQKIIEVKPEAFPWQHPENVPEEPAPQKIEEPVLVP